MAQSTDFGPGYASQLLYSAGGVAGFSIVAAISRTPVSYIWSEIWMFAALTGGATVLSAVCGLSGARLSKAHKRAEQRKRDDRAAECMRACASGRGDVADFSLYLRAFEITGQLPFADPTVIGLDTRPAEEASVDFETSLAAAVENDIPVVALGNPGEQVGAGRILTDEGRWKADLHVLASRATILFIVPSIRPGTLWEVDWIIENRALRKTLWLLPPTRGGWLQSALGLGRKDGFDWAAAWQPIAAKLRERGIESPAYATEGAVFTIGNDGKILQTTGLKGYADAQGLAQYINQHLLAISKQRT